MFQVESILGGISAALCCGEFLRAARKSGADSKPLDRSPDVHLVIVRSEKKYSVTVARTPIAHRKFYVKFFEPQRFLRRNPLLHQISWRYFFSVYNCNTCNFLMKSSFSFENQPSKPCCVVVFFTFYHHDGTPLFLGGTKMLPEMDALIYLRLEPSDNGILQFTPLKFNIVQQKSPWNFTGPQKERVTNLPQQHMFLFSRKKT